MDVLEEGITEWARQQAAQTRPVSIDGGMHGGGGGGGGHPYDYEDDHSSGSACGNTAVLGACTALLGLLLVRACCALLGLLQLCSLLPALSRRPALRLRLPCPGGCPARCPPQATTTTRSSCPLSWWRWRWR